MKARIEGEVAVGWQVEKFAREGKRMMNLSEYLHPPERRKDIGAQKARILFERMKAKQERKDGSR